MSSFERSLQLVPEAFLRFSGRAGSLICLTAILLNADTLTLRNGATVQGTYLGGTSRQVRMDQNGDVRTYDVAQVQSVIFSDSDQPPPPPPPAQSSYPSRDRASRETATDRDSDRNRTPPPGG